MIAAIFPLEKYFGLGVREYPLGKRSSTSCPYSLPSKYPLRMICKARPSGGINQPTSNKGEAIIFRKMVIKKMRAEKRHEVTNEGGLFH